MKLVRILIDDSTDEYSSLIAFLEQHKYNFTYAPVLPQDFVNRRFVPPFRVGRKQKRAVLDSNGLELVVFPKGLENWAEIYCLAMNKEMGV